MLSTPEFSSMGQRLLQGEGGGQDAAEDGGEDNAEDGTEDEREGEPAMEAQVNVWDGYDGGDSGFGEPLFAQHDF